VCQDFVELDRATDALGSLRIGGVTLETSTFVVARGKEQLPLVTGQKSPAFVAPDTRGIESLAQATLERLGPEAVVAFNLLDARLQPRVLDAIRELQEQVEDRHWDDGVHGRVSSSLTMLSRAVLEGASPGTLHGPIINIAQVVEASFKEVLERIVRRVYGRDLGRAQKELRLRSRKLKELSLGNIVVALRTVKDHDAFEFVADALDDEWLDRLEQFSDARNRWAHAGRRTSDSPHAEIDDARRAFSEGVTLVRWVYADVVPVVDTTGAPADGRRVAQSVVLPAGGRSQRFGLFLSHSTKDAEVADRIAVGLRALMSQYPVWYSDWAIKAGESIVEKINEALTQNDTLVVLLSNESVASPWVQRELSAAVMGQLAGQDVAVVPILIEDCTIPPVLQSIRYIDMRPGRFEEGFVELLRFLRERQRGRSET
jgi:hypothetical protein